MFTKDKDIAMEEIITKEEMDYLVGEMRDLLAEYDYKYTERAIEMIVDEWAVKKRHLIRAFKNHPRYVEGKFMIAFTSDFERAVDEHGAVEFSDWLEYNVMKKEPSELPEEVNRRRCEDACRWLPNNLWLFLTNLGAYSTRCIDERTAEMLNNDVPMLHAHAGQKTSRVVNKICACLGYDKHKDYNREFAKYADSLSPMKIKRHTILSIHPIDYLTMSFGNSWSSCHTIDKKNKRGMGGYHGVHCSGTMSYMLDQSSMVFYVVDASYNGDKFYLEPKINRQMFHYGEEKLIQSRLYPQSNDGAVSFYDEYRNIVQNIIAEIFNFPNYWTIKRGYEGVNKWSVTRGTHYPDYVYAEYAVTSILNGSENQNRVYIGASPLCISCGHRHSRAGVLSCCTDEET